jgi:hypothetical protein
MRKVIVLQLHISDNDFGKLAAETVSETSLGFPTRYVLDKYNGRNGKHTRVSDCVDKLFRKAYE